MWPFCKGVIFVCVVPATFIACCNWRCLGLNRENTGFTGVIPLLPQYLWLMFRNIPPVIID